MPDVEADMVEWPHERRQRLSNYPATVQQRLRYIPSDLLREVKEADSFTALVRDMIVAFNNKQDPQVTLAELWASIEEPSAFGDYDETARQIALTLAGVAALQSTPTREMWEFLWSLAWHSNSLKFYLPQAVIAAANDDSSFRDQFLAVARSVVEEAIQNPGRRAIQREAAIGAQLRERWLESPQLSALWRDRFEHSLHAVGRDDDHVLSIVAEIDPTEFVQLLELYDYPDPVLHGLMASGVGWRFEHWRSMATVAPPAFDEQSEWNGSLIFPLLLAIARDQFQFNLPREPAEDQTSEISNNIKSLSTEIAKIIAHRADAAGSMTRWGNWLVRSLIPAASANRIPHPTDAASQGFIEDALLDAFIDEIPTDSWSLAPAQNVESWEPWCQHAFSTLIALAGKGSMPSPESFLDEWELSPEDWSTERGKTLQLHATPFEGTALRADGYGARILAISMLETESPDTLWARFWDSTVTLRELVEFGDSDDKEESGWRGRRDAANLLKLQFSIGLMIMDHIIWPLHPLDFDRSSVIESLLRCLAVAVEEMNAIDQLNGKYWSECLRHLAIRRANWFSGSEGSNNVIISDEAKPTLVDFIQTLSGDTENLLTLAYVAQLNGVDKTALATAFTTAGVALNSEIALAEHLLEISPRAIGIDEAQLNAACEILHHTATRPG